MRLLRVTAEEARRGRELSIERTRFKVHSLHKIENTQPRGRLGSLLQLAPHRTLAEAVTLVVREQSGEKGKPVAVEQGNIFKTKRKAVDTRTKGNTEIY